MAQRQETDRRHRAALRLAWVHYLRQIRATPALAAAAFAGPALGNVCIHYLSPLVVAGVLADASAGRALDRSLWLTAGAFLAIRLLGDVFWRGGIHALNRTDSRGIAALHERAMAELLRRDLRFFEDNFAGSLTKRVTGYASQYEEFVDTLSFQIVGAVVPFSVASVVLWRYDPLLVVVLLGSFVVTAVIVTPLILRRQAIVDEREAATAATAGHVADTLSNMEAVRSSAAEHRELRSHRTNVERVRVLNLRSWDYHNLRIDGPIALIAGLTNAGGLLVALRGGGPVDVEAVFLTFAYYSQATSLMFEFNQTYRNIESSVTEAAQFTELLLDEPRVVDRDEPEPLAPVDSSVRFDGVRFGHAGHDPLFDGLDLHIASGERVGFVGRSGGGKTTLARLLLRLMDVDGGTIRIGGQDISALAQADLRSLITSVPQDPVMFHRSIHDNIAFGVEHADAVAVRAAAAAAHATEFIDTLPDGFETLVGERGVKLSGGQRQRIAIARAILRDAPILVLDEATSALDSESEALIQAALEPLIAGRTALVIAHRLSTVQRMDRLVVLDHGRIVEQGSHDELLDAGGTYAGLWRRQSGGFLGDESSSLSIG